MLLLIALVNVHVCIYGVPLGVLGYPHGVGGVDQVVALLQITLVDGRAYPLFGLLFGYGVVQLVRRRAQVGVPAAAVTSLVRRRGAWMIAIGFVHGALLWPGDIVGAYGLVAVLLAGTLVRGTDGALRAVTIVGVAFVALLSSANGVMYLEDQPPPMPSLAVADPGGAFAARVPEWLMSGLPQALGLFAAVALGVWAGRRGLLDEPARHRRLLRRLAVVGFVVAVLGGLPLALMVARLWADPPLLVVLLAGSMHALGGYAGGVGYGALFGLAAARLARRGGPGLVARAVQACGQRSLSCYLAQSVAFAALLPAWTLGLGNGARLWQTALLGVGAWLSILVVAALSGRLGYRGPAEQLLRRLTYGRRDSAQLA